ncbi:MAG: RNA-binding protein [bacterium]|nr:RNA-binding protein [bacterium]
MYLVEENDCVASLHRVHATKISNNKKIIAEVHAFFQFKNDMLTSCNERTEIIQGSHEDKDLGRRK